MLNCKWSDIQSKLLSVSGGQMSWATSGLEKPPGFVQSQLCFSEIRYSTKHPHTAADALHWENEVGAANSLKQHNAYITDSA